MTLAIECDAISWLKLTCIASVFPFPMNYFSPGALAAWLRLKHPDTVVGSVATSAPVLAKVDFCEYLEVVNASLATSEKGEQRGRARQ